MIKIKNFNPDLLKIDKKSYKNIGIYYTGIIDYEKSNSVNPLQLIISKADEYIEQSNGNKHLIFASTDKSKKVLIKYTKL